MPKRTSKKAKTTFLACPSSSTASASSSQVSNDPEYQPLPDIESKSYYRGINEGRYLPGITYGCYRYRSYILGQSTYPEVKATESAEDKRRELATVEECARKGFKDAGLLNSLLDKVFF